MLNHIRPALVVFAALTVITGVVYPLAVTAIAQVAFPRKANGSLIAGPGGAIAGSSLIGQEFGTSDPALAPQLAQWFWGRPSVTGPVPYTSLNQKTLAGSSGSNLAVSNPARQANLEARVAALRAAEASVGLSPAAGHAQIPIDLVTASGSGLDPHISPAAAEYQVARVAKSRGMTEDSVRDLVRRHSSPRELGLLGEPVVNVLELNLALQPAKP